MASGSHFFVARVPVHGCYLGIHIGAISPLYPWLVFLSFTALDILKT
jgi:hypothetical protein